jgi:hypothetical protein
MEIFDRVEIRALKEVRAMFQIISQAIMKIYCLCCHFDEGGWSPAGLIFTLFDGCDYISHKKYSALIIKIAQLVVRQMRNFREKNLHVELCSVMILFHFPGTIPSASF